MKAKCGICGTEREREKCVVITPTENETEDIRKMGQEPLKEYIYCTPCYRLVTDREHAARFLQGLVQTRLRALGNPRAEEAGKRMYDFLINRSKKVVS